MIRALILFTICFSLQAKLPVGQPLKEITLEGKNGGRLDGSSWSSKEMLGTAHILFYVDPDRKNINEPFSQALKKRNFPLAKLKSVAIINMDATWLPNFAIENALKEKQKEYATTLYLKDFKKYIVKEWNLKDDDNDIVVFDKKGNVRYSYFGKMEKAQIDEALSIIEKVVKE